LRKDDGVPPLPFTDGPSLAVPKGFKGAPEDDLLGTFWCGPAILVTPKGHWRLNVDIDAVEAGGRSELM
jgi:hypothetical protein